VIRDIEHDTYATLAKGNQVPELSVLDQGQFEVWDEVERRYVIELALSLDLCLKVNEYIRVCPCCVHDEAFR
jgi:hypothetical protein